MQELKDMTLEELWKLFPIVLQAYNEDYPKWYTQEKERLLASLSHHKIYRINHIGSTSIDGMIAKPVVDILLELETQYPMDEVIQNLKTKGWSVMAKNAQDQSIDLNKGYTLEGYADQVYHLHIKPAGDWDELYFRDYLRKYPQVVSQYEILKLDLKHQFEFNRQAYTDSKTEFVERHTKLAREEFGAKYRP